MSRDSEKERRDSREDDEWIVERGNWMKDKRSWKSSRRFILRSSCRRLAYSAISCRRPDIHRNGCGEPQYLVQALVTMSKRSQGFLRCRADSCLDSGRGTLHDEKLQENFRLDSFFVGDSTRNSVNRGAADYTPIFLSSVPIYFVRS